MTNEKDDIVEKRAGLDAEPKRIMRQRDG